MQKRRRFRRKSFKSNCPPLHHSVMLPLSTEKMNRRKYLKYTAGIVGGLVVGAAAGYYGGVSAAPSVTQKLTETVTATQTVTQAVTSAPLQGEFGPWPPTAPVVPGWPPAKWAQYPGLQLTGEAVDMYLASHNPDTFGGIWARRHDAQPPKFTPVPYGERHPKIMGDLAAGSDLDIVYVVWRWRGELRKGDYLLDLTPWYESKFPKAWFDSIPAVKRLSMQYGNKDGTLGSFVDDSRLYGVPIDGDTPMVYYRKDIFKDMGLDPEKLMTPEGRLETYKALNRDKPSDKGGGLDLNNDGKIDCWAWQWMMARRLDQQALFMYHWMYRQWKAGKPAAVIDEKRNPLINNEEAVMSLEDLISYIPYMIPGSLTAGFDELQTNYAEGRVAVFPDTGAGWRTSFENPEMAPKTAGKTNYMPSMRGTIYESCLFGVNKRSKHPDEALEYLLEWSSPDIAIKAYEGLPPWGPSWMDPPYEWMWEDPEFETMYPGFLDAWKRAWQMGAEWPAPDWPADEPNADMLMDRLDYWIIEAYTGRMKPKDALDACADEWKTLLVPKL